MSLAEFNRLLAKTRKAIEDAETYFAKRDAQVASKKKAPPEWLKPALKSMEETDGA